MPIYPHILNSSQSCKIPQVFACFTIWPDCFKLILQLPHIYYNLARLRHNLYSVKAPDCRIITRNIYTDSGKWSIYISSALVRSEERRVGKEGMNRRDECIESKKCNKK